MANEYKYTANSACSPSLDIMFVQDFTGSQEPYIDSARKDINSICRDLLTSEKFAPSNLRFGLIAFRDHPPQDVSFVTKQFNFTSNPESMASNLASLTASGGGDGPEAQIDALSDALNAPWTDKATKVVVLITDSPPHGIGDNGDQFPDGCPLNINPLHVANEMAKAGITLNVIACEPTLSQSYKKARDFYEGLAQKTGGNIYSLGHPDVLAKIIIGCALEAIDSDKLVAKHQARILEQVKSGNLDATEIPSDLLNDLMDTYVQHYTLAVENTHEPSEQSKKNAQIWFESETMKDALSKIKPIEDSRIKVQYLSGSKPVISTEKKPISLPQVKSIVQKSLMRGS